MRPLLLPLRVEGVLCLSTVSLAVERVVSAYQAEVFQERDQGGVIPVSRMRRVPDAIGIQIADEHLGRLCEQTSVHLNSFDDRFDVPVRFIVLRPNGKDGELNRAGH